MVLSQYLFSILFLAFSAYISAIAGGSSVGKAILRICFWGTAAMLMTASVGCLFSGKIS
ncbi:VIT1/CCC1 family predicted Fe2+/Mn2+ transporter [Pedobacter sp. CG_S7]